MRKALLMGTVAAFLAGGAALPAWAAEPAPTPVTFVVTSGGGFSISAPTDVVDLGVVDNAEGGDGSLGSVTVVDDRGVLGGNWTATVVSTDFLTAGTPDTLQQRTIEAVNISYAAGADVTTGATGVGVFLPGSGGTLDTAKTAATATATVGRTSATWNPTITVAVPADAPVGTYAGTITHSVA